MHESGRDAKICFKCLHNNSGAGDVCETCGAPLNEENSPPHHLKPGSILAGKYLVGNALGEGGFGITYLGLDLNLDIKVAIKEYYPAGCVTRDHQLSPLITAYTGDKGQYFQNSLQKFIQEAKSLAKFSSLPGIVSVKDFFRENGTAYIVMEFVEGVTLKAYLEQKGGSLPTDEAFALLRPVLDSLALVHKEGIIHRDISPDNIMVTDGAVKLIDFGAARSFSGEERSMSVLLKPGYAPEEQYRTKGEQGPWTDVYALCATLYRCITGQRLPEALDRLRDDPLAAPSALHIRITPQQEAALLGGLAVYRENRIQSMEELGALLYGDAKPKPPDKQTVVLAPKRRIPVWALATGGSALAVVLILAAASPLFKNNGSGTTQTYTSPPAATAKADYTEASPAASRPPATFAPASPKRDTPAPALTPAAAAGLAAMAQANRYTVACGNSHVAYIKPDGSLGSVGSDVYGQRDVRVSGNIVQLAAGYAHTAFLRTDGTVGATAIKFTAGVEPYEYGQSDVSGWSGIIQIEAGWVHTVGLRKDGSVVAAGDNKYGQCNVQDWRDVVEIAAGAWNTAALTKDGRVLVTGDDTHGPWNIPWENEHITHIAVGRDLVAGLREDGTVIAAGRNEQNQLDVSGWRNIVAIAAGDYHVIGLREDGTVVTTSFSQGKNACGQDKTGGWRDIIAVYGGARSTVGLCADGTLLVAGLVDQDSYSRTGEMDEKAVVLG